MGQYAEHQASLDASGMRIAIVAGRFNDHVTRPLLEGARHVLEQSGAEPAPVYWVPGAFEIPLLAKKLAESGRVDAVVCLGAVIRGDTPHFEYVAGECARGLMDVGLDTGVPVVFGVLTTDDLDQALARAGGSVGNKGEESAQTAIEMVAHVRAIEKGN
jgi:6,7-dimethyl-8-ribityllumazine synthase